MYWEKNEIDVMTSLVNKEAFEYLWKHNKKTLHDKEDGKKELPNKENIFHMRERESTWRVYALHTKV